MASATRPCRFLFSGRLLWYNDRVFLMTSKARTVALICALAGLAAMEEARAALADEVNLNPRLVVERAFLQLSVHEDG